MVIASLEISIVILKAQWTILQRSFTHLRSSEGVDVGGVDLFQVLDHVIVIDISSMVLYVCCLHSICDCFDGSWESNFENLPSIGSNTTSSSRFVTPDRI